MSYDPQIKHDTYPNYPKKLLHNTVLKGQALSRVLRHGKIAGFSPDGWFRCKPNRL